MRSLLMGLKLNEISKKFGDFTAVHPLTLDIPESEIYGFLGGNGAGKTTTFRMILGLIDSTSGSITWRGKKLNHLTSDLVGYLPEERGLYPKLKVKEQLIYLGRLRGMSKKAAEKEIIAWLEKFEVPHYLNKKVEELSKGNQQKIQFISSVLHKPKLLILDEPFSGLDPLNVEMLKKATYDLKKAGTTIIFSSHQMSLVLRHTYWICLKLKAFIITTIIMLVFVIGVANIDSIIKLFDSDEEVSEVIVIDEAPVIYTGLENSLENDKKISLIDYDKDIEEGKKSIENEDYDALLILKEDKNSLPDATYYTDSVTSDQVQSTLEANLQMIKDSILIEQAEIDEATLEKMNEPVNLEKLAVDESAKTEEELNIARGIVYVMI